MASRAVTVASPHIRSPLRRAVPAETQGDAKLHKEMRRQREKEAKKERKKEGKGKRGKKGAAAEVTSGLLSAEAERRMEENGGLQAAGLIRGVGQGMDGGADVHEEWD